MFTDPSPNGRQDGVCACGRLHPRATRHITGRGVLVELPGAAAGIGFGKALVVSDLITSRVAGDRAASLLAGAGFPVRHLILPQEEPHADEASLQAVRAVVVEEPELRLMVSAGAGTITDIVRLAAHGAGLPFVAVATAASMDGYASTVVPFLSRGFKETVPAVPPAAVLADLDILTTAPAAMTLAGFGDLVGKLTARADWVLSHLLTGEYYCAATADLAVAALQRARSGLAGLAAGDMDALAALSDGLLLSGLAMQMIGNSRPASGSEHHLAHFWEERALHGGAAASPHGARVGVAAVLVAGVARRLAGLARKDLADRLSSSHVTPAYLDGLDRAYGPLAPLIRAKGEEERNKPALLCLERWDEARAALAELAPEPAHVRMLLRAAGAPADPAEIGLTRGDVLDGLMYAHEMRPRFTVLALAARLGLLPAWAEQIAEESFRPGA
ncbi:MAG: iron-containing alcohol dehydrogenase [Patescibacteria group bacterium]